MDGQSVARAEFHVFEQLREWKRLAKRDTRVSFMAVRDPRAPWHVKALAAAAVLYALSPFDLVPDLIPLHGVLDDLLVFPLAVMMIVRLIPEPLKLELQETAEARMAVQRPHSHVGEFIIIVCLLGIAGIVSWLVWFR